MESKTNWHSRRAIRPLGIVIVGGGIAGLAAGLGLALSGHQVTILERSHSFSEVGAGIQLAPNAMRILERFGVLNQVLKEASILSRVSLRRYADNQELASFPLNPQAGSRFGSHACVMHRADLQQVLLLAAQKAGCRILTSKTVVHIDPCFAPLVQTADGTWFEGDVVLACDGLASVIRKEMEAALGESQPKSTGEAAYRILMPRQRLKDKPHLSHLLDGNMVMRIMGPQGHIMAYPVRKASMYNLVVVHPVSASVPRHQLVKSRALNFCRAWSPLVQQLLSCVSEDDITEWTLYNNPVLPRCVLNRVVLVGDASHAMLPFVAQGSAAALEDAGVLVAALTCTEDIDLALAVYQESRQPRCARIQADASEMQHCLHLGDGERQRARDEAIRRAGALISADGCKSQCPDRWLDETWQDYVWGFDVMEQPLQTWHELVDKVCHGEPCSSV